jgi:GTP-binding protein
MTPTDLKQNLNLRNTAIIAHVDHGKTTLVDALLTQSGSWKSGEGSERVMDNLELERERGITIAAKNCSLLWKGVKINILDTPGHADFSGEVERALSMVDGAILLVDASEGPLPQTRFVLSKALQANLQIILVINKIDRQDARPQQVLDEVYDLFIDLDATEEQLGFPVFYASSRDGIAKENLDDDVDNLHQLLDRILDEIPAPSFNPAAPFQMLVSNIGYSSFLGRLAIGKIVNGRVSKQTALVRIGEDGQAKPMKTSALQVYSGLQFATAENVDTGEILVLAGADNVEIGDTICEDKHPKALKRLSVDEPTLAMRFLINTSPTAGLDGKYVQSKKIRERLHHETLHNIALRVLDADSADTFVVQGRGEFQMAILLETMRREGYELCVGRPEIIFKEKDGKRLEPIEHLFIDCPDDYTGIVTEKLSIRKGRVENLINHGSGRVRLEFSVPSRGLIGYRAQFLTDTRGMGIMNALFSGYEEYRGDFPSRTTGSLVSDRAGDAVAYALFHLEPRGQLFVTPGMTVYEGMVVGEHSRANDLNVNPCKTKKLSNMRAAGKDENVILAPVLPMTLERAIEFIREDELVEVTPKNIRLRKQVLAANIRPR